MPHLRELFKMIKNQYEYEEVKETVNHLLDIEGIRAKRWYDLYNSKSAVALKPKVSFSM
jgi:hypothetical protein